MNDFLLKINKCAKNYYRKIIQFSIAILYNINFVGFRDHKIYTGPIKNICVPGLNCYSCPGAIAACPIGSIQSVIAGKKYGVGFLQSIFLRFPIYVLGFVILFGVIFGRVVCSFLCPFGLIQELLYKIKTPKIKKNFLTRKLTIIKYFILIVFVFILPIIINAPAFCKYICPEGTLEAGIFHVAFNESLRETIGVLFNLKLTILIIVVVFAILHYRVFCKYVCPLGAIYSLFNNIAIFRITVDKNLCINCNACINSCLMDVKKVGDRECIECGECIKVCPASAIDRIKIIRKS